jgi:hypothetical protein
MLATIFEFLSRRSPLELVAIFAAVIFIILWVSDWLSGPGDEG